MQPSLLAQSSPLGGTFANFSSRFGVTGEDAPSQLEYLFSTIFGFITIVGGLAFLIYFTIGALNWITAGGDQQKVDNAKKYMTNGAIGMIVIIAAYSITVIIGTILGFDILNPANTIQTLWGGSGLPTDHRNPNLPPGTPY
jgi:hypothetical protein